MPRGNNVKKNEEVRSLYSKYSLTKDEERVIHDMITEKNLDRKEIEKIIREYKGLDCDE